MQKGSSGTYSQVGFHVVVDKLGTPFRYELSHSLLQSLQAKEVNLANGVPSSQRWPTQESE